MTLPCSAGLPSLARQLTDYHAALAALDAPPPQAAPRPRPDAPVQAPAGSARARLLEVFAASAGKWLSMPVLRLRVGDDICPRTIRAYVCEMHGNRELLRMGAPGRYLYRMPVAKR